MNHPEELRRAWHGVRVRWWLVLLLTALGGVMGYFASTQASPVYRSSTSILVGQIGGPALDTAGIKTSQALVATYADLARRGPVLQGAVTDLDLPMSWLSLREQVHVDVAPNNAQLITIMVDASSPEQARAIADRIATNLVALSPSPADSGRVGFVRTQLNILKENIKDGQKRVAKLQGSLSDAQSEQDSNDIQLRMDVLQRQISDWQQNYVALQSVPEEGGAASLRVLERAVAQSTPISPNIRLDTILAAAVGFAIALAITYLLEFRTERRQHTDKPDGQPEPRAGSGTHPWLEDAAREPHGAARVLEDAAQELEDAAQELEDAAQEEAIAELAVAEAGVKVTADGQRREVTRPVNEVWKRP